ncbi:hypothetical protein DQ04_12101000, partial [Trypanosoma grayi]|uniref:hypothetical protein n=1 Tax=Trypanosoma grayi TaxID=71804 RepID=UPI0004F44657
MRRLQMAGLVTSLWRPLGVSSEQCCAATPLQQDFSVAVELLAPRKPPLPESFMNTFKMFQEFRPECYILPTKSSYFAASGSSGVQEAIDYVQQQGGRVVLTLAATTPAAGGGEAGGAAATREGVRR